MNERIDEDLLDCEDEVVLYNGKPFSGVGFDPFSDGSGVEYETEYVDGLTHGMNRKWYKNGKLAYEVHYSYGIKHGKEMRWFDSGVVKLTAYFEYGVEVESTTWNEAGAIVEHFEISPDLPNFVILQDRRKKGWDFTSL
ncbi:hypothetical protein INH39_28925 [Massilia violaceinigra]|uniref:Toxin-antitoxin system YwqK family antitoxin n=1 Tax=Massilia violaceinigra TaxID=2045208 RepID=A0ABY4A6V1_9BURK|nr:hypothetical protein [Massilia violaceinigra]UOD29384.1 hypothetical protein INH39_28925 [Massilia violaceinigra]